MKILQLKNNLEISDKDLKYFGGEYSLREKIALNGIGSKKVIYVKGIPYFDLSINDSPGATSFVNFELLREGFIIRLNQKQKNYCVGVKKTELIKITLIGYEIHLVRRAYNSIVHKGKLIIESVTSISEYEVPTRLYKDIHTFFEKRFNKIYENYVSDNPPEIDNAKEAGIIGFVLSLFQ